jgi:aspartyl-tRNA(Asn)/glutamyl-tRNA(Gln) amidotransferase subunit C
MADLDRRDVDALAVLARLELDDEEAERLAVELGAILDHMVALAAVDTAGVEPMTHAVPMTLPLRDDVAQPSLAVDQALVAAPDREDDCFRVPAAIKTGKADKADKADKDR